MSFPCRAAGREEGRRVTPALVVVEPDGGGAVAYEREVQIASRSVDIAEQPAVAVDLVERRVGLERDDGARRQHAAKVSSRGARIALRRPGLGRVDLEKAHPRAACEHDRVAVDDALDARDRGRGASGGA
jgi:hypothetical protein